MWSLAGGPSVLEISGQASAARVCIARKTRPESDVFVFYNTLLTGRCVKRMRERARMKKGVRKKARVRSCRENYYNNKETMASGVRRMQSGVRRGRKNGPYLYIIRNVSRPYAVAPFPFHHVLSLTTAVSLSRLLICQATAVGLHT